MSGLSNQPRMLKGAFVDSNQLTFPPLVVPFQFNPEQITRRRGASVQTPPSRKGREETTTPERDGLGESQTTTTEPETISLDIRLDATDALEADDPVAAEFGVLPALSALELMITPRAESLFAGLVGLTADFGFGDRTSIPVVIFVWDRQRVYPVRLTELNIQEVEYNPNLTPTRVIVGVGARVLAGGNPFYLFTEAQRELMAALNFGSSPDLARSIVNL